MSLTVDNRLVLQTSGIGDLAAMLDELYGPGLSDVLDRIEPIAVGPCVVAGVVAGSELTRPNRGQIHVVVNGRWVHPRGLLAQIERTYRPLLPRGRHPVMVLAIIAPPDRVDVNVHPAKLEVRLRDERAIADAASQALLEILGRRPRPLELSPVADIAALGRVPLIAEETPPWEDVDSPIVTPYLPPLRLIGQAHDRLLLLEGERGLVLVDQHRAHERVLFERLRAAYGPDSAERMLLPEPLTIELRPAQAARFGRKMAEMARLGFAWEEFGGHAFLLRAAPRLPGVLATADGDRLAGLGQLDGLLPSLLALADDDAGEGETWRDRLLVSLSCRTAIRRGRPLERPAMRALVELLGECPAPAVCPHGSPLLLHVEADALARQFDWE
jgi:DNA mismatch repair protein MutL